MRYEILNTYVDALTMDQTIERIIGIIDRGIPTQHVVINASKINLMEKDSSLQKIVNNCELINADGSSVLLAAKILNIPLKERVTGIDLFEELVKVSREKEYKIFLFGAKEDIVTTVKHKFETNYPGIKIVGYRNGYFKESDNTAIVKEINESQADIVFVAFSSPQKEYWIHQNIDELHAPFIMGVGGSFDVFAGKTKRSPKCLQKIGMEWFYRFIQEPRRMWKRYIIGNFTFLKLVFKYKTKMKKSKERQA